MFMPFKDYTLFASKSTYLDSMLLSSFYYFSDTRLPVIPDFIDKDNVFNALPELNMDDVPGGVDTEASIDIGGRIVGSIENEDDQDWFRVDLVEGETYDFSLLGVGKNPFFDSGLRILDANGVELKAINAFDGTTIGTLLQFTATSTGLFYISVQARENIIAEQTGEDVVVGYDASQNLLTYDQTEEGPQRNEDDILPEYSLTVTERANGEIANNTLTNAKAVIEGAVTGEIETLGDADWFAITLEAGHRYIVSAEGFGGNLLSDPTLALLGPDGEQLKFSDDYHNSKNSKLAFEVEVSGTYYIQVASNNSVGEYAVTVQDRAVLVERSITEIAHFITDEYGPRQAYDKTEISFNISELSEGAKTLARLALDAWSKLTPLVFNEVETGGDIVFNNSQEGAFASSFTDGAGVIISSEINISTDWNGGDLSLDGYTYQTFLHEIGHALGLGHSGPYNFFAEFGLDNAYLNDSFAFSLMSYFGQNESEYFGDYRTVLGPQIADIVAIQDLYGVNSTTRNGDTVYGFNSTETDVYDFSQFTRAPSLSIFDTGGEDTLDFSGYAQDQIINLNAGTFSDINGLRGVISIALGVVIENAIGGSGVDTITGNDVSNVLTGNGGNDILDGGAGEDYAVFSGASINEYTITENADGSFTVAHNNNGADGTDTLTNIEFVRIGGVDTALVGEPYTILSEGNDRYTANNEDNRLDGLGGNDVIYAAGGNDVVRGGDGADRLFGDDGLDELSGDAGADYLYGGRGNDILHGGAGGDFLYGGLGDDAIYGGAGGDVFVIFENAGTDTIYDFENDVDIIRILNGAINYSDLTITQEGNAVHIVSSFGTIILDNFDLANVDASNFDFVGLEGRPVMVGSVGGVTPTREDIVIDLLSGLAPSFDDMLHFDDYVFEFGDLDAFTNSDFL